MESKRKEGRRKGEKETENDRRESKRREGEGKGMKRREKVGRERKTSKWK